MSEITKFITTFSIDETGYMYNITQPTPPETYTGKGTLTDFLSGFIYKIETLPISNIDPPSIILDKKREGSRFYPYETHILNSKRGCNYNLNFKYKKNTRVLIKGLISLNLPPPHYIKVELYEIISESEKIFIGSSFTNELGEYYFNLPIKTNCNYEMLASYTDF
ncbi:hypothetical protein M4I33_03940 [Clostridium sp. LY3-2]|uniref:hypothetical protein n=1 Tax=Clostridium sp. LY3-2 TaxID=2942482 RepID=UPI002152F583|nr:hypothetical protein [Clostridium sp. LY3-2]MCR6514028.1 hypothetical protein [Clostridium sp. LY3-2]